MWPLPSLSSGANHRGAVWSGRRSPRVDWRGMAWKRPTRNSSRSEMASFTNSREELIMKVVVATTYGTPEVLKVKEIAKPVPGDDEILVKVRATTVNVGDVRIRAFN